jgi:hypothetical protein
MEQCKSLKQSVRSSSARFVCALESRGRKCARYFLTLSFPAFFHLDITGGRPL